MSTNVFPGFHTIALLVPTRGRFTSELGLYERHTELGCALTKHTRVQCSNCVKALGGDPPHTQKYIIHIFVLSSVSLKKHNFKINTFLSVRIQSVHTEQNFKVSAMTYLTGHCIPKLNRIVCNWLQCTTL